MEIILSIFPKAVNFRQIPLLLLHLRSHDNHVHDNIIFYNLELNLSLFWVVHIQDVYYHKKHRVFHILTVTKETIDQYCTSFLLQGKHYQYQPLLNLNTQKYQMKCNYAEHDKLVILIVTGDTVITRNNYILIL